LKQLSRIGSQQKRNYQDDKSTQSSADGNTAAAHAAALIFDIVALSLALPKHLDSP
jgi:hypothetical protein